LDVDRAMRIGLYFRPQRRDTPVDAAWRHEDRAAAHRVQNHVARKRTAWPRPEVRKQRKFFRGEIDLHAIARHLARGDVHIAVAESEVRLRRTSPAQKRTSPRNQLARPKRLGDVVVGTEIEAEN